MGSETNVFDQPPFNEPAVLILAAKGVNSFDADGPEKEKRGNTRWQKG
jgi:hypothetical protein